jgi:hypothetical protein
VLDSIANTVVIELAHLKLQCLECASQTEENGDA